MIHVGTAEDVLSSMTAGWALWGRREAPPKRGYTYWLEPDPWYRAKRVSPKIVAALVESGRIAGDANANGDLNFRLVDAPAQGELLKVGA